MFTGIVKEMGKITKKSRNGKKGISVCIVAKRFRPAVSASICVNGVCLTITKKAKDGFWVDVVHETLRRTNLRVLKEGAIVNLESSLKAGDEIGGHFVTGHVDDCGTVLKNGDKLVVKLPSNLKKIIIKKGSVAVNGVSLTVAEVKNARFTVALIPFTRRHTNLGFLKKGDTVNIEADIFARYVLGAK